VELASGPETVKDERPEPAGRPRPARPTDTGALLLRHASGDPAAFAELVAAYRRPVYSWLVRCGVREADRDDVFQSVFLRLHRSAGQYQAERPAHPWIFTIVANEVRSSLRRRRIRELVLAPPAETEPAAEAPDAQHAAEARETVAWLESELARLPLAWREALLLVGVQGRSLSEAAEALGRPLNTIKTHLRRARLSLAEKLARRRGEEWP
jgi:RNA polymerase sigma-70 factor (ECF subfamily)